MKKTKAILIMVVLCTMASVCWGQSYWKRTYGGAGGISASAITPTPDGNFIVTGQISSSFYFYFSDVYILNIKPNGDTLWTKTYGRSSANSRYNYAYCITPTLDENFIIAGLENDDDVYLLKIKPNGDTLWTKTFGNGHDWATAITPTIDGNFIVVGFTSSFGVERNVYLLKIKPNGDTLWTKTYGRNRSDYYDYAQAITPTPDGNYIIAGYIKSFGVDSSEVYLLKIKSDGDTLWTKTYGGADWDNAYAITPTPEGNCIVAGYTKSFGVGSSDVYLLNIKPNGDTLWTKTYGGAGWDDASAITPASDGNFIVAGSTKSFGAGSNDFYLLKIKPDGDTLWTKTYGGTGYDGAKAITPTPDGNFIVAGYTTSFGTGGGDIWLISIIDDRYAKKDSLFTFKISVSGDSLSHGYAPLRVPAGMTVSPGGTISWTPKTDSVYMDHVEFLVSDDFGKKDTLTFNIFLNSSNKPTAIKTLSRPISNKNQPFSIMQTSPSQIKFTLPPGASSIDIYDINGRCVQRLKPIGAQAIWNGFNAAGSPVSSGRYFAKIKDGKTSRLGQFMVVR